MAFWIIYVVCWLLIPAVLIAKVVLDRRAVVAERECWRKVDEELRSGGR